MRALIAFLTIFLGAGLAPAAEDIRLRIRPRSVVVRIEAGPGESAGAAKTRLAAHLSEQGLTAAGPLVHVDGDPAALRVPVRGEEASLLEREDLRLEPPRLVLCVAAGDSADAAVERCRAVLRRRGLKADGPVERIGIGDRVEIRLPVVPTGRVDVAVYAGRGTFGPGLRALSDALETAGLSFRVLDAEDIRRRDPGKAARVLVVPGGWAGSYVEDLGRDGAARIRAFVEGGGGYLGICAGSYFAASRIVWEGQSLPYPLDLFPGTPTGSLRSIAPWPEHALADLRLNANHAITRGLPQTRRALYYGGPALRPRPGARVAVLARFAKGDVPALVAFRRGQGRVLLSSFHPEIRLGTDRQSIGWPAEKVATPDPESDHDLLVRSIRWLLGRPPADR